MIIAIREIFDDILDLLFSLRYTIRIWDIIDILIIAFLIYRILSFMRKTSASSVIKGLFLLVCVAWFSNLFDMIIVSYIVRQVMQMGILVIIVLFQPEIRKLFEQMGTSRINILFRNRSRFLHIEKAIIQVTAACEAMISNGTGAIIVFERQVGLIDYAVTGVNIDADISSELIQNIFYENSPLHDGALLIREGRLLAAACMLPLTTNININRELGMRHRAGVGLSERSDAVIAIVSEQSGAVSVAVDGMLKRQLDMETFEKLLKSELMLNERKTRTRKERKIVTQN